MLNPSNFILKDIPKLNPLSIEYQSYWRDFKKKCIEGEWVQGKWIPGNLWFYLNACVIELNKTRNAKTKVIGRPLFFDYLLEVSYLWNEARGLIGFDKQPEVLAYKHFLEKEIWTEERDLELKSKIPNIRTVLANSKEDLGKPLYLNDALDFMWLTARDTGKSFYVANAVILHEFLFDGAKEYNVEENKKLKTTITVGAGVSDYSIKMLEKTQLSYTNLPGAIELNGRFYPSPLSKKYSGSWAVGKKVTQLYKKKTGGSWQDKGTGTTLRHVTYKDNPFAAQGSRNSIIVKEECGHFDNLLDTHGPDQFTLSDSGKKFGSAFYLGTGGNMEGGGCVCAGTKVWDIFGNLYNIEDLPTNQGIVGFNQETQTYSKEPISYWQDYTEKPCYRITTNSKRVLECSEDHPILFSKTNNFRNSKKINGKKVFTKKVDWIQTKDLEIGNQICIIDNVNIFSTNDLPHARLIGLLIGDGTYRLEGSAVLSNCDKDINNFIQKNYDCKLIKSYLTKDNQVYKEQRIRKIIPILKKVGIYGQTKTQKTLPDNIHSYSKNSVCELLGGLFDTDGTVSKDSIQLCFSHFSLIDEVRLLLQKLGIHCTIIKRTPNLELNKNKKIKSTNSYYYLQIKDKRSVETFHKNISFLSKRKQQKLNLLVENNKNKLDYYSKENIGLRFEKIINIEYIGIKPVYNLTADATNTYVANGIVTHNTIGAKRMFYAPDEYNLLTTNDVWENKGKIAYFTPATIAKRNYKDENGYTNLSLAEELEQKERNKIKKGADASTRLANYIQYNPLVPSEVFLSTTSNIFPVGELQDVLAHLESNQNYLNYETVIDIYFDKESDTGVSWKVDLEKRLEPITEFPLKDNQSREGAVIMYEEPIKINGKVPDDAYIIGHDPVANDNPEGPSLSATYILKNKKYFLTHGGDEIVAEYISRPSVGRSKTNETLEKLWMMYGSPPRGIWFENAVGNTKEYFEKRRKLVALCTQPETVLSKTGAYTSAGTIVYGYPMSNKKIKKEAELYVRDWLIEERGKDSNDKIQMNLHLIKSRFLLKQLISYASDGNFDAVMGFMGCIIGLEETHNQYYQEQEEDPIIQFLINNDIYFNKKNKGNKNKNIYEELDNIFKK